MHIRYYNTLKKAIAGSSKEEPAAGNRILRCVVYFNLKIGNSALTPKEKDKSLLGKRTPIS
jgi:hypothetical protein